MRLLLIINYVLFSIIVGYGDCGDDSSVDSHKVSVFKETYLFFVIHNVSRDKHLTLE